MMGGNLWRCLRDAVGKLNQRRQSTRRRRDGRRTALFAEWLERRELLSVNQIIFDAGESRVVVQGTADADQVSVVMDSPSQIRVRAESVDGAVESTFQVSSVASIVFFGSDGNDRFENQTSIPSSVYGEGGDDVLIGGSGADYMQGGLGNDRLSGDAGDDDLRGQQGDDELFGLDGNDLLTGGAGNDYMLGGLGNDRLSGDTGDDDLRGEDGDDQLFGLDGHDVLTGGAGNDYLLGGLGNDRLSGDIGDDELRGQEGDDELFGLDGNDLLTGGAGNDYMLGGLGNDRLSGDIGDDELRGQEGDDELFGLDGNDLLTGGADNDYLLGGLGNDRLSGDTGDDDLRGQEGDDELFGLDGNDLLTGGAGNDYMLGGLGNDQLSGDAGDDELRGQEGDDELFGLDGNDVLTGGAGNDYLLGGLGNDRLSGHTGDDDLRGQEGDDELFGLDGNDLLTGGAGNDYMLGGLGNDRLSGDIGDDELRGQEGDDELFGLDGNDLLTGGADNDYLLGGLGNDQLSGDTGDDDLRGQEGDDELFGLDGNDLLTGGAGNDYMLGGLGNDQLSGDAGDDELRGQEGDDELFGLDGNDVLTGGAGNDYILGGLGNDRLSGDTGDDDLRGEDDDDQLFGLDGHDVLTGGAGNDYLLGGLGNDRLSGDTGDDDLRGEDGDDQLFGLDGHDVLTGGAGNDYLLGGEGNDRLIGDTGADDLRGGEGNDLAFGMEGDDLLTGGAGDDSLNGGEGNDQLAGDVGDDELYGEDGDDKLFGMDGSDLLVGGIGNDHLSGSAGADRLFGDAGDDELHGEDGNDYLEGSDGNDQLDGGAGVDFLMGMAGDDILIGEGGSDLLSGGDGDDAMRGGLGNDVLIGGLGEDQVYGDDGSDLLIGGYTSYDSDEAKLQSILNVWAGASSYSLRIGQLEDELSSVRLMSEETVFDDQLADEVFGNDGQDWFFLTGFLGYYDPNLAEDHEHGLGASETDEAMSAEGEAALGHTHPGAVILDHVPALEGFAFVDSLDKLGDRQQSESLHSLIPHADDPVLQREHLSLFQLVRYSQVTHYAVASGAWSDPNTWHDGVIPGNGARALIPIGVEVTVDRAILARIGTVRVDGTLSFSTTANSELRVDTIVVSSVGHFEMGTEAAPIPATISARLLITDNGPIDRVADPFGISRGLISHGSVSMHGAAVTSHVAVNGALLAGTNLLTLKSIPTRWKVGDTIVVASSTSGAAQNEVRKIVAIFGSLVFLDRPLTFNHAPISTDLEIHVANTTRNVSIASESTGVERRGHVMFMHNRDVHVANTGFYQLGRTDKSVPINDPVVDANWQLQAGTGANPRGRYAVHFHRNGFVNDGNSATISGSAVVDSAGWGFVNHSSYVDMWNNVAYDVHGAAFATEVGDEIGSFVGNIAIGSTGSGESVNSREGVQDFGHQGDGFWFQGTGISVTGNVAAGNEGSAYVIYARGLIENGVRQKFLAANLPDPSIANGEDTIDVQHVPMRQFSDNVGYASGAGLSIRYHLRDATHTLVGTFSRSSLWGNVTGIDLSYSQQVVLRDSSVVSGLATPAGIGIDVNLVTRDIRYENLTVAGYYRGIVLPRLGYAVIDGGRFDNYQDFLIETAVLANRSVSFTGLTEIPSVVMARRFEPVNGSIAHIFFPDRVTLDAGPINQRIYYLQQAPLAIPFPVAEPIIPTAYIGLTSLELWVQFGVAVGGTLAPANAVAVPEVVGLLGPVT